MSVFEAKKIGVTGGAGFIGSHLVEFLTAEPLDRLVVVDDFSTGTAENLRSVADKIELVHADIADVEARQILSELDLVFHLAVRNVRASIARPIENFAVNANGTQAVLESMQNGVGGAFVYVSSSEVYGIPAGGEFSETTVPTPTTVYGAGKLAGEYLTHAYRLTYGLDATVIRPFNNFGPRSHFEGDSGEVIPKFILRALAGAPLLVHGDGTQTRDFMYVTEAARWIAKLGADPQLSGLTLNIGTGLETRIIDLARMIIELTHSTSDIVLGEPRPGDLPRLVADTRLVREVNPDFGLDVSLQSGLEETIASFQAGDLEAMLALEIERTWE